MRLQRRACGFPEQSCFFRESEFPEQSCSFQELKFSGQSRPFRKLKFPIFVSYAFTAFSWQPPQFRIFSGARMRSCPLCIYSGVSGLPCLASGNGRYSLCCQYEQKDEKYVCMNREENWSNGEMYGKLNWEHEFLQGSNEENGRVLCLLFEGAGKRRMMGDGEWRNGPIGTGSAG